MHLKENNPRDAPEGCFTPNWLQRKFRQTPGLLKSSNSDSNWCYLADSEWSNDFAQMGMLGKSNRFTVCSISRVTYA